MKIKILYTDKTGVARFTDYTPNCKPVNERVSLSEVINAGGFQFRDSPPEIFNPWHCTAMESTQWVIVTNGIMRVGLRDGSSVDFLPGEMFLSMDTQPEEIFQGHNGHTSQAVGKERLNTMFIKVDYKKCLKLLDESLN